MAGDYARTGVRTGRQRLGQTALVNERLCGLVREAERAGVRPSWSGEALLTELRDATGES
jgi:2-dehydropantoate 2-reductase